MISILNLSTHIIEFNDYHHHLSFPFSDACKFGVSESVIGLILGMYHLTVFVVAPVTPILIGKLTVELTLKLGILVAGISAILFGFLNLITNKIAFILVSVVLRCIQVSDCCADC